MKIISLKDGQNWYDHAECGDYFINLLGDVNFAHGPRPKRGGADQWRVIGNLKDALDLSPLAGYLKAPVTETTAFWPPRNPMVGDIWHAEGSGDGRQTWPMRWVGNTWVRIWDYYGTTPPTPEPSPADKALDDFIAKRKAKREKQPYPIEEAELQKRIEQLDKEYDRAKSLDRALSKAYVHHAEMTDRLMPFKVVL